MTTSGDTATHTFGESRFVPLDDGRKLHYRIRESGGPTVVFESGMGFSGAIWGLVTPAISERTTTVVYDRAGAGLSDDDDQPRTLERSVADLAQLLRTLPGPLVLVGASWGGPLIRAVAATKEFDITGLVLVDQSDENAAEYFTPAGERRMAQTGPYAMFAARTGIYKLLVSRIGRHQPTDVYADFRRNDFGIRAARLMGNEAREFLASMRRLQAQPSTLEGIDVAVISGTKVSWIDKKQRPALNDAHRKTAADLDKGRFVEAPESGHYVMFSEPGIIVDEITRLLP